MAQLTERQFEVYEYIKDYIKAEGYPPSRTEIANYMDIYPNGVTCHLKALQQKGAIVVTPKIQRAIKLVKGFKAKVSA